MVFFTREILIIQIDSFVYTWANTSVNELWYLEHALVLFAYSFIETTKRMIGMKGLEGSYISNQIYFAVLFTDDWKLFYHDSKN